MKYIIRAVLRLLIRLVAKVEVKNKEFFLETGSYAFASNHLGFLDAPLAYYALDRWDFFIPVAEKWEEYTIVRWAAKYLNIIFIDRFHTDFHALRQILRRMEKGEILIIAPEGTRSRTEKMAEGKVGVSYLASKAKVPVIPVAIEGTEDRIFLSNLKKLKRTKVTVTAGNPLTFPPLPKKNKDQALREYTDEIMCHIAAMLPEKNRGFYAEHPRLKSLLAEKAQKETA
jgi:1-acyl-sn-glycerol-3-phosphate acyltransferase